MINHNSKVKLHYSISSIDDVVFESTFDKEPIDIKIGSGIIPQKLEMTLYGLSNNSEQTITLKPSDAFGERYDNKIKRLSKSSFPNKEMVKNCQFIQRCHIC